MGQYLRAPDVYFEILQSVGKSFIPLCKSADEIHSGIKTGINDFFYVSEDKAKHWKIEKEFLVPIIKSPRESESITVFPGKLKQRIFCCGIEKVELKKLKKYGALAYIEWGEKQVNAEGQKWPNVSSVNGRGMWYDIGQRNPGQVLPFINSGDIHRILYNPNKVLVDHNLFEIRVKKGTELGLLLFLNSSLAGLFKEVMGRSNLGEGGLKVEGVDWERLLCPSIPILKKISTGEKQGYTGLLERPIKPIFEEVKMKDRQQLDSLILDTLGLDPKKYLKPLYAGLTELVRERIELGKMRTKVKKAKIAKDIEALKNEVLQSVLSDGPKKFPEDFLEKHLKPEDCVTVSVPGEPLKLGAQFLTQQEVIAVTVPFKYMAGSVNTAKYIVYAQKPDVYLITVPKDDEVIGKAVQAYGIYLRSLQEKLATELANLVDDYKLIGTIVSQIFTDLGLPEIPS